MVYRFHHAEWGAVSQSEGDAPGVQSVVRAFRVLEALADHDSEMAIADVAAQLQLAPSTVHRLLATLSSLGYARHTADRRYTLGPSLIVLGDRATPQVAVVAGPVLEELERATEETVNLAVLDGDLVTYVAQRASRHQMRMFTEVGHRVLPHASGVGKAILGTLPQQRVTDMLRRTGMPRFTDSTITTETALLADLRESRRRGFTIDDGEQEVGVRCIAVAVPGATVPTAVSISGPAVRISDASLPDAVAALSAAARYLGELLGSGSSRRPGSSVQASTAR